MRLAIMGTPGAGKGTQAKLLAGRFGACHISTGDVLREAVRGGSPLGLEAKRYMEQGLLVPDDVVIGIVAERLDAADCQGGFLLDGFPRTVAQAKALDALLARRGQPLGGVLLIALPREAALERLAGRRVCEQCSAMFHSSFDPPAQADRCDRCGGRLVQRGDDREETVRHRMEVYARETAPVLEHYRAAGLLREIDGTGSREDVFRRVATSV
ncbi:MAG: adenylate kinase [Deltaproteobacteria bacterium]|nr:MAG: adenylate kinase [Deltaproteobacteria bacterium]